MYKNRRTEINTKIKKKGKIGNFIKNFMKQRTSLSLNIN